MNNEGHTTSVLTNDAARIDALGDEFERAFKTGSSPRIEDFLSRLDESSRPAAFRELLKVEVELRRGRQESVRVEDYLGRFSSFGEAIHEACVQSDVVLATVSRDEVARPVAENADTRSHRHSDTGSGRLEVRCPNCHEPTEVAVDTTLTDLTCSACGSHFSLVDQSKATHMAPSLTKMGRFELIERLGVGGFGSVWKARDKQLDRTVAIKIPRAGAMTAEEQEKFFREARAAAQLKHPSIVSVHEVGRDGDSIYIVSDFVRGVTLGDWLTGQKLTSREAAELCAKIADALHHAHEQGVVHRDLKLANIMMDYDGHPHLMDFGLARRETGEITVTMDGQIMGTPAYMSPEQAQGEAHTADRRSDVYSLGVILFQLLTSELPFRGNARMLIKQVIQDEPPSPRKLNANVSKDLETITLKCLEKEPARRYPTAHGLATELRRFLAGEPIEARPVGRPEQFMRWVRRNKTVSTLSSAVALALVLGAFVSTYFAIDAQRQADVAFAREKEALTSNQKAIAARHDAEAATGFLVNAFESLDPNRDARTVTVAEVLDRAERQLDEKLPDQPLAQAAILDAIGRSRLGMGMRSPAIDSLLKARDLRQRELGGDHLDTISSIYNLANAYYNARRFDEAIELFKQTVALRTEKLGNQHPDTFKAIDDLGVTYSSMYFRDKAIRLHEQCLASQRTILGADHPDTLKTMYHLAVDYDFSFRKDEAIRLYEENLKARRKKLGNDHPDSLRSMKGLADAYYGAGRVAEAIPLHEEVVTRRRERLGPDHPDTLKSMQALVGDYYKAGRINEAISRKEEVLAVRTKLVIEYPNEPGYRSDLANSHKNFGNLLASLGDADGARNHYEQAFTNFSKLAADFPDAPIDSATLNELASLLSG